MMHRLNDATRKYTCLSLAMLLCACTEGGNAQQAGTTSDQAARVAEPEREAAAVSLPDFRPLVREYGDSVVNVEVLHRRQHASGPRISPEDPLYEFFRRFGIPAPELQPRDAPPARGAGSGFIVSADGYILTNAHVVADADEVTVRLTDRREFQAQVIGIDERTDIAVIKIEAENLPTVRIGDPNSLEPGQWVLAIGSPFGLQNSVTAGIVSATSRAVGPGSSVPFIQTDVAVNPGNSGGPLFNLDGEVVGVNSMIFSRTGGYMGLSFAIPIDVAVNVQEQLIERGRVVRGRIGVIVQDVNAQLAESFGLDRPRGALVSSVEEDGPADEAGVEAGDIILTLNGEPIDRFNELGTAVAALMPGSEAVLTIWRDGEERELDVRIGELEQEPQQASVGTPPGGEAEGQLGLVVRPLTEQERERLGTDGSIVIERVNGAAAAAGLQPGDVVLGIGRTDIDSVQELRQAIAAAEGSVALRIQRGEASIYVPVDTD
jgi:serine protease Do